MLGLGQVGLMILAATIMCLHIDRCFIGLDVAAASNWLRTKPSMPPNPLRMSVAPGAR
jgi:hypothetical protein